MKTKEFACAILIALFTAITGCNDGSDSVSEIPGVMQAESATSYSGGASISRSTARGGSVWHLDGGQELFYTFSDITPGNYSLTTRYSNDDAGGGDIVAVIVNGAEVGSFRTVDTGNDGLGWNVFVDSAPVGLGFLSGTITISIQVIASDGYGVDFDMFMFNLLD
jgi:hypothetical protein